MPPQKLTVSLGEVRRAGETIRELLTGDGDPPTIAAVDRALDVILEFRACHQVPLTKAAMGLRSTVVTVTGTTEPQVSQRLKRMPTITDKLVRQPKTDLSRMQDIGGCRAILPDVATCYDVHKRLLKRRGFDRDRDYIADPRDSGYRGIHVILKYDDRRIEVQLRTPQMHQWAVTVERLSDRTKTDLKSGDGPAQVLTLMRLISEALAIEEAGGVIPDLLDQQIKAAQLSALPFLQ